MSGAVISEQCHYVQSAWRVARRQSSFGRAPVEAERGGHAALGEDQATPPGRESTGQRPTAHIGCAVGPQPPLGMLLRDLPNGCLNATRYKADRTGGTESEVEFNGIVHKRRILL